MLKIVLTMSTVLMHTSLNYPQINQLGKQDQRCSAMIWYKQFVLYDDIFTCQIPALRICNSVLKIITVMFKKQGPNLFSIPLSQQHRKFPINAVT